MLDEETIAQHVNDYRKSKKLKPENGGSVAKFSKAQTTELIAHLEQFTYTNVQDICVMGKPDQYWGEIVVAVYVPSCKPASGVELQQAIIGKLSKFKHPKLWIPLQQLPRNSQGKLNHKCLRELIKNYQDQ